MANSYLKRLRAATETILKDAYEHRNDLLSRGAVNWADLHCVAALRVVDDEDRTSYRVEIEEVAPDASDLQRFIAQQLEVAGFFNIEVYTEWQSHRIRRVKPLFIFFYLEKLRFASEWLPTPTCAYKLNSRRPGCEGFND